MINLKRQSRGYYGAPINDERILFFEYIKEAHDLCKDRITEDCSIKTLNALGIEYD